MTSSIHLAKDFKVGKKISTVMPVFIQSEENLFELEATLGSLAKQTLKPDEVIISSNNTDFLLNKKMFKVIEGFPLNIIVHKNLTGMNAQANTNNGVTKAKNEIIHILHHDDPIVENFAYSKIYDSFENGLAKWAIFSCHNESGSEVKIQPGLIWGFNSIGGPSVLVTLKESYIPFSANYLYLWDCVNFHEYNEKYGSPLIFRELHIAHGDGDNRLSKSIDIGPRISDYRQLRQGGYATTKGLFTLLALPRYWGSNLRVILKYASGDKSWSWPFRLFFLLSSIIVVIPGYVFRNFSKTIKSTFFW